MTTLDVVVFGDPFLGGVGIGRRCPGLKGGCFHKLTTWVRPASGSEKRSWLAQGETLCCVWLEVAASAAQLLSQPWACGWLPVWGRGNRPAYQDT